MKKTLFILVITLLISNRNFAQVIEGKVVYQVTLNTNKTLDKLKKDTLMLEYFKFEKMERINSSYPINFILLFNKNESIYKPEFDLDNIRDKRLGWNETGVIASDDFLYYTDLNTKETLKQYFFLSHLVISTDSISWNLEKEMKQIGKYLCYKATAIQTEELPNREIFSNKIVAWYTDQIPVPFGIQNLNGLPGLTIELDIETKDGYLSYLAVDVDLNPKEKIIIENPKGNKISHQEYINIVRKSGKY